MLLANTPLNEPILGEQQDKGCDGIVNNTTFSVDSILNTQGGIDFDKLLESLSVYDDGMHEFFKSKENIEKILFPLFDYLRYSFFSMNVPIPEHIVDILRKSPIVRDAIVLYVSEGNKYIMSSQHIEQYDTISFHLFLLGIDQEFDLVEDIQDNNFSEINGLFKRVSSEIDIIRGKLEVWNRQDFVKALERSAKYLVQVGETVNKLALVHSENFEDIQISFQLGTIIQGHIDPKLSQLTPDIIGIETIQQLEYLFGRAQTNFAHGAPINTENIHQIQESFTSIRKRQRKGFIYQEKSNFGGDPEKNQEPAIKVFNGNTNLANLMEMRYIEEISDTVSDEFSQRKTALANNIRDIYADTGESFLSADDVIDDCISGGVKNEYRIESILLILVFDDNIKNESLVRLVEFFLQNKSETVSLFYEKTITKIIAQVIRRFSQSKNPISFLPIVEKIGDSLRGKDISQTVMSYSQIYIALALYYIKCPGAQYIKKAKTCFLYHEDLSAYSSGGNRKEINAQERQLFYTTLGREVVFGFASNRNYLHIPDDVLYNAGKEFFSEAQERYKQSAIISIEMEIAKLMASINTSESVYAQNQINDFLGKKIAKTIFYNLCTITVIGDCGNCGVNQDNTHCQICKESPDKKISKCPLISCKRGFQKKIIPLSGDIFIAFVYPIISERIFEKIFLQHHILIEERFGSLIAINNKNDLLRKQKIESERQASYDDETSLLNVKKLRENIAGKKDTLVLIEVAGYDNIKQTPGGEESWTNTMQKMAEYLSEYSNATVYRHDKTQFGLVYDTKEFADVANELNKTQEEIIMNIVHAILMNSHDGCGKNMQFYAGIVIGESDEHIKLARTALVNAKKTRGGRIHIFRKGDEKPAEEIEYYTKILKQAIDPNNPSVNIIPYYQRYHDTKNPDSKKCEALARMKRKKDDGQEEIISPFRFIDIAIDNIWLPEVSTLMIRQIISDMSKDPSLEVSINLHEQDWHNSDFMGILRTLPPHVIKRLELEILETVSCHRGWKDILKIRELQRLGYRIAIDDYGVEKGNLKKVIDFGPDKIKIDRDIVQALFYKPGLDHDENEEAEARKLRAIASIKHTVKFAREIGAKVTAEYVDSEELFLLLQELGVDYFQGYYHAEPMPFENIVQGIYKPVK